MVSCKAAKTLQCVGMTETKCIIRRGILRDTLLEIRIKTLGMNSTAHHQNSTKYIIQEVARIVTLALKKTWKQALSTRQFYKKIRQNCLNTQNAISSF